MGINWSDLLISLLPFLIIVTVWLFIVRRFKKANKINKTNYDEKYNEMSGLLREIRDELKELNKNNSQKQ